MSTPLPFQSQISRSSPINPMDNAYAIELGDGYLQTGNIGLNHEYEMWNVVWQELSADDFATLRSTLSTVGTVQTLSANSLVDGSSKLYQVVKHSRHYQPLGNGLWTVSLKLRQVFIP